VGVREMSARESLDLQVENPEPGGKGWFGLVIPLGWSKQDFETIRWHMSAPMDTVTLVSEQIDDGEKLVRKLSEKGFEVSAAFWILATDDAQWSFYIVSPLVESEGLAKAYRRLHEVARQIPQPSWIDPLNVKLIGPSSPIAHDVLAIHARTSGPQVSPIRWGGKTLGNLSIEEAYLYPRPAAASN
jgi:hypothetical protein